MLHLIQWQVALLDRLSLY